VLDASEPSIKRALTRDLTQSEVDEIRDLLFAAFADDEHGAFTEEDWQHSIGGTHFLLSVDGRTVCHASVVDRELHVAGRPLRTGYVEAVATAPGDQRRGYGSAVMREVNEHISRSCELGALGTGSQGFYERLGWRIWRGPTYVRAPGGDQRTADEDGYILVLATPTTPPLDLDAPISCDWREGDVW
jgi:aminoglycoside 2'-N-acetyltransferase I